jgi:hypothetical protein
MIAVSVGDWSGTIDLFERGFNAWELGGMKLPPP